MAKYKEEGCLQKLIVTGCLAQRYSEDIFSQMPEVDALVGTGSVQEIEAAVEQVRLGKKVKITGDIHAPMAENLPRTISTPSHHAYLKISDGCDNSCTYCIIPKLRGRYRSRTMEAIVQEAEKLAAGGVIELNIIAQDTTRYGVDIYHQPMLPELLLQISKISQIKWIRLHYCYPELISDALIDEIAGNEKICKYLDIPLQHASDCVLKAMGRIGTETGYRQLIEKIRRKIPTIAIRSTFITGFPGETQKDFEILAQFLSDMKIDKVGIFAYSEEEDTPAALMPGQVDAAEKEVRRDTLMKLQQKNSFRINKNRVGSIVTCVCEKKQGKLYCGRTQWDSPDIDGMVMFTSDQEVKMGEFVEVKITSASEYDLIGVRM